MKTKKISSRLALAATMNVRFARNAAVPAAMMLAMTMTAGAQLAGKGSIVGVVKDPSGAIVPGATITATNVANGATVTRVSTGGGDFTISPLDAGIYTVTTTMTGFEKITQQNVHVNALEVFNYNPTLTVGSQGDNITVSAAPPAIQGDNATLGGTLEQETYAALPIQVGAIQPARRASCNRFCGLAAGCLVC